MSSDSEEHCITLEALSKDNILNPKYRQCLSELLEMSTSRRISGLMIAWKTKCVYLKVAWLTPLPQINTQWTWWPTPANSLSRDTALDRVSPSSLGKCSSSEDEEQPPMNKQIINPEAGCSMVKVFDPILPESEKMKTTLNLINWWKTTWRHVSNFRHCLSKEGRAMLKADSKPDYEATTTSEVHDFLQTFWKGKINNIQNRDLNKIQTAY